MLARFQKILLLALCLYGVGCYAWLGRYSPWLAVAAALLPMLAFVAVMGLEFVAMQRLNRHDPVAQATGAQLLRAWWNELGAALLIFCWRQPFRSQALPDWLPTQPTGARGVVLVHGLMCNRGVWLHWLPRLRQSGHAYVAVNLEPVVGSIDAYAGAIEQAVQRVTAATGMPPVLVCHSMGGLAARAWLRAYPRAYPQGNGRCGSEEEEGDARVHRILTLGTPHAGTWLGRFSHAENGRQMRLGSPWLQALGAQETAAQRRLFVCWYSHCDNIVFPASTAALPGAQHRFASGVAHLQMALHPQVMHECMQEIAGAQAGQG